MFNKSKRIVSFLVSALIIASSLSVGFSAFAAELTSLTVKGTEAIMAGDTQVGTATHYDYLWSPQKNWEELHTLGSEGTTLLTPLMTESEIHTLQADGTYVSAPSNSINKILVNGVEDKGDGSYGYKCENGDFFQAEMTDVFSCSNALTHAEGCDGSCEKRNVVVKQHGWDKDGYYYYDYFNEDGNGLVHTYGDDEPNWNTVVKLRDDSVTAPYQFETYTYTFPEGTKLQDAVIANSTTEYLRSSYYEIYATTGKKADLYKPENLIAVYDGVEGADTQAFASHYNATEAIDATYVGLKLIDPVAAQAIGRPFVYYNAARIWALNFYGTSPVVKAAVKYGTLNSALYQTELSEDNYSIPAKLYAESTNNLPQHIYYKNGIPASAGVSGADARLWDGLTSTDVQFDGRETYQEGGVLKYYDGTHTELYYDFGDIYEINEIIYANHNNEVLRASDFTFYASNNFEDLFTDDNKLVYVESNVAAVSVKTLDVQARYVGISFQDTCWGNESYPGNDYLRACEFDVRGKYSADGQTATVTNFSNYTDALAAIDGKQSVVAAAPEDYAMVKGVRKEGAASNEGLARLYNGNLSESDLNDHALAHTDADGKYVYGPDVYTAFKYDLKLPRKITDVFLGNHDNSFYQTCAYKVYVSDDAAIDESDMVAQVNHAGRGTESNIHATLISLPEGTEGRYVEVRIFMPQKMCSDEQDASYIYYRLKELNIFGDMGYTMTGANTNRETYFTNNAENIANSLIANTPIYKTENITAFNFGTRGTNTSELYKGMKSPSNEDWTEATKSFTETTYYDVDGDLSGVSYTNWIYGCSNGYSHAEGCDENCEKTVEVIDDGSVYQTVIYKLSAKSTISEVDIYHSNNTDRLTSHYMLSFAEKEADLFGENATNIEVVNQYRYNLVKLNEAVTAKFFAVKLLCGVQPDLITSADYNYGRMGHFALVGEARVCPDGEHAEFVEIIDKAPTCKEVGIKHTECSFCGFETAPEEIETIDHTEDEGVVTKEPTCKEKGVMTYSCSVCGEVLGTEEIDTVPHTEEAIPAVAPTCQDVGYTAGVKCSVCDEVLEAPEEVPVDENAHVEEEIPAVAATCKDVGYTAGVKCSVCDEVLEAPEEIDIDENNHTGETEVVDAEPADCTEPGYTGDTICSDCGATLTEGEEIAALGHKYEAVVTPPTCDEAGFTTYTCSVCSNTYDADEVPALGHKYDDGVVTKKATCTSTGTKTFTCSCGDSYTEVIPMAKHTEVELKAKAATCTATGLTKGSKCSVCGKVLTAQQTVPKKAHTAVELKAKAATCTKTGLTKGSKCSVCGTILTAQKTVAKKAHSYKTTTTKATLKKNGKIISKCTVCGKTASTTTIYYAKTVKLSKTKFTYTGKTIKPTLVVKTSKGKTISSKYYTVTGTRSTKKIGKFKITLKFKGNYSGTKTLYYTINPKTVASLKLKAGKKQMTVSYKKDSSVGGYEIMYATNKSFKKAKTTKATSAKKTIKKLTSKKTYYVKVRAYKKVSGKTYYGAYCKAKTVKVK